jgi:hypothetical protein
MIQVDSQLLYREKRLGRSDSAQRAALMEQMNYNLLFRWFVGLELDEPVWNHAVFSKNRERLLNQDVAQEFFGRVLTQAKPHLSDEHFTHRGRRAARNRG